MGNTIKIAIVGSGPAGLSAAAHAAALGLEHVLLEAQPHLSNTIHQYQRGKHVMAEPSILPLRSDLGFEAGKREAILARWNSDAAGTGVKVRHRSEVVAIRGERGSFALTLASGEQIAAHSVVLAIGMQGNLRQLDVPGAADADCIQYQLDDPKAYSGEDIVVVGAGDAAIETINDSVDLTPWVWEDTVIDFPQHPLCAPDCSGLKTADPEGSTAVAETEPSPSPWAQLDDWEKE